MVADKVIVQGVLGNTVGRVGKIAGRLLLGRVPDTALEGSFQEEKPNEDAAPAPKKIEVGTEESAKVIDELEDEIFDQVFANGNKAPSDGSEREWKVGEAEKQKERASV